MSPVYGVRDDGRWRGHDLSWWFHVQEELQRNPEAAWLRYSNPNETLEEFREAVAHAIPRLPEGGSAQVRLCV